MRILFLSNLYPPHDIGGHEQLCQEVTVRLNDRSHTVNVLTSRHGVQSSRRTEPGVTRSLYLQTDLDYYHPLDFFFKRSRQERANLQELRRMLDKFRPDVVMVWGVWNLSLNLLYWLEQWMPSRVTYYIGSYWPTDIDPDSAYWRLPARRPITELLKKPLRKWALHQLYRKGYPPTLRFERALCCSKYVRDHLVDAGKLPSSAGVIHGGIDPNPFLDRAIVKTDTRQGPLRLLYFGRLIHDKGVHTAVEAMGLLREAGVLDQVELTILGSGHPQYEEYLKRLVAELGVASRVHFIDKVSRDEIPRWLRQFDTFLFTSIWPEPFGRTIVEAMAAGLVVIGSDVGGSREIFQEGYDSELLFPPEDHHALAHRIVQLIDDPERRQRMAQLGRQLVLKRFTLTYMVDRIESHLVDGTRQESLNARAAALSI
jgi:glycogen synthase